MRRLGVCSWSLRPEGPEDLADKVRETGLGCVQLALDPLRTGAWSLEATVRTLERAGIGILSGMMAMHGEDYTTLESIRRTGGLRPEAHFEANLAAARENARLARRLGLRLVTFHAGFLPDDPADPEGAVLLARVGEVARTFAAEGVRVGLETGQETAGCLARVLDELARLGHEDIGVNFDPANMILYGKGDPVEALRALGPRVVQIHVKDALPTATPGTWGTEVPVDEGAVDWAAFFRTVRAAVPPCDLAVERESGEDRVGDVWRARVFVAPLVGSTGGEDG